MKALENMDRFQVEPQSGEPILGRIAVIGLVVILVSAWALTEPMYELGKRMVHNGKLKQIKTKKGKL